MNRKDQISEAINILRFPLIFSIVFIHFNISQGLTIHGVRYCLDLPFWLNKIAILFSNVLACFSIPLFFAISGYLFFRSSFNVDVYKAKMTKRSRSLLVPYILWNLIALLIETLKGIPSGNYGNWTIANFLATFWDTASMGVFNNNPQVSSDAYPQVGPLWFVRDLIVVSLLSPLVYYMIKRLKLLAIVVMGILWTVAPKLDVYYLSQFSTALFFFSLGAYCSLNKFLFEFPKYVRLSTPVLFFGAAMTLLFCNNIYVTSFLWVLTPLLGIVTAVILGMELSRKGMKANRKIVDASFFIYVTHGGLMPLVLKAVTAVYFVDSPIFYFIIYFMVPAITVSLCIFSYTIAKRVMPSVIGWLTGGR